MNQKCKNNCTTKNSLYTFVVVYKQIDILELIKAKNKVISTTKLLGSNYTVCFTSFWALYVEQKIYGPSKHPNHCPESLHYIYFEESAKHL